MAAAPGALAARPVAHAARVGSAHGAQRLTLDLPLRTDGAGLARFAAAVSDPSSPVYGRYESVATLSRRFGATPAQRRHVLSYLRSVGSTDVSIDVTGQFADATMPVATAARVFGTDLDAFRADSASGVQWFVAPTAAAHVSAALAGSVTGVIGLDTRPLQPPRPAPLPAAEPPASVPGGLRGRLARWSSASAFGSVGSTDVKLGSGYTPRTGTPAGCPGAGSIATASRPTSTGRPTTSASLRRFRATAPGERVAVVEIDGFKRSDIGAFGAVLGCRGPDPGLPCRHPPRSEAELRDDARSGDAARVGARGLLPRRRRLPDPADRFLVLRALTAPLRRPNNRPDVISASLGICEPV